MIRKLMYSLCLLAPLMASLFVPPCAYAAARSEEAGGTIEMFTGEARVFPFNVSRIAVGNGRVISVSVVENKQILVLADAAGSSTLHLWLKDGSQQDMNFSVIESNMKKTLEDVNKLLTSVEGVTARIAGTKIVLEGDLVSDTNQERVQTISKMYPDLVVNFIGKVGFEKMIYMDVKVLELTTKGSKALGIAWDSQINGPAAGTVADLYSNPLYRYLPDLSASGVDLTKYPIPNKVWPPKGFISLASVITSKINLMVQDGDATLLAAPNLTTRSGSKAKFIAGGEIPLPVISGFGQTTVDFKEYGIILEVTPVTDKSGTIYAKVNVEVSTIDPSVSVQGIPGLLKRQSTTEFNSRDGEAVVLSGLYSFERSRTTDKVPGAGDVPVIGNLFKSNASATTTREVAVVITPRIVTPTPTLERLPADINGEKLRDFENKQRDNAPIPDSAPRLSITE